MPTIVTTNANHRYHQCQPSLPPMPTIVTTNANHRYHQCQPSLPPMPTIVTTNANHRYHQCQPSLPPMPIINILILCFSHIGPQSSNGAIAGQSLLHTNKTALSNDPDLLMTLYATFPELWNGFDLNYNGQVGKLLKEKRKRSDSVL